MTDGSTRSLGRRHAIAGAAGLGVVAPALVACGSDGDGAGDGAGNGAGDGGDLTTAADVPVGGGTILPDQKVVVTQPTAGDFKAFTAVCTHQGCLVGQVTDGTIQCPCHGSQFSIEDGSNVVGPSGSEAGSVSDLAAVDITVEGDAIRLS
ncbi:Rieske (2Fe-2S) protein [Nocardioides sp.]|uniref:Rieske (2Fe-2S) protein n=1 Tax=Nocardioides sp. TaxID=35761 RepID=UPI002ED103D6